MKQKTKNRRQNDAQAVGDKYREISLAYAVGAAPTRIPTIRKPVSSRRLILHLCPECNIEKRAPRFPKDQADKFVRCKTCIGRERKVTLKREKCLSKSRPDKLKFARELRRNMTHAELHLWQGLKKLAPLFSTQEVLYGYIADFCCFRYNLIVEVDGSVHYGTKEYDAQRDKNLMSAGFKTRRFTNEEVLSNRAAVIGAIVEAL